MGYWRGPIVERFWRKVNKLEGDDACWEWTAGLDFRGYGMFNQEHAHRFSYHLHYGEFDRDLYICHKCDNPKCVRPEHLFQGTQLDNMRDRKQKGKYDLNGSKNPRAILNEEKVGRIKVLLRAGRTQKEVGDLFGVSKYVIHDIAREKNWKSVP